MKIIVHRLALSLIGLLISSSLLYSQPLDGSVSTTKVSCQGGSDGSATVTATGGSGTYTYQWYNPLGVPIGANITTINGLSAGTFYRCRIRDGVSLPKDIWFDISENPALIFDDVTTTDPLCNGATGTIVITPLGGVSPYMYSVNGGADFQASNSFNVLAGSYNAIITDSKGCITTYLLNPIIISHPLALTIVKDNQTDISCFGDNTGEIKVTGTGGTGTLTYTLKKSGVPQVPTQTGASGDQITFSTLVAGDYTVEVTDTEACGPASTPTITLTEPAVALTVTATPTNATGWCKTNGSILATGSGGQSPYQYSINGGPLSTPATPLSYTFSLLAPNTYTILVQDANGCTATALVVVGPAPLNANVVTTDATCFGDKGTITITAPTGGSGAGYRFTLSLVNPISWKVYIPAPPTPVVFNNLTSSPAPGTSYTVYMIDNTYTGLPSGCNSPVILGTYNIVSPAKLSALISGTTAICPGGSATLSVALTGTPPWNLTYTDGTTPVTVNGILTSPYTFNVSPAVNTTYTVTALSNASCTAALTDLTGSAIITINSLPAITGQPSNQTVCAGGNTSFSVTATGAGLIYQWQLSTDNGVTWNNQADGGVYSNMTAATMSITGATNPMNNYQYRCVVSGTCPPSVNSTAGILTVNALPAITGQPVNSTVCVGGNTTFSVTATGAGLTYQWQLSTDNGVTWNNQADGGVYSNMTTATMSITGATNPMNTYQYRCVVSGTCPPPANSTAGILTVNALPNITTQPTNKSVCVGGNTTFSVTATGAGLTYQWQLSTDNGVTWNNQADGGVYSNMTTATMSITGALITMNTYQYRCVVSGTCPPFVNSTAGILTVNALPAITGQPVNSTVCAGGNTTFSVTATGAGLTYQWQLSTNNGVTWANQANGGVYSSMTTATMSITGATNPMNNYQYRCVVSGTCPPAVNSTAGILTVNALPTITVQPSNQAVCVGGNTTFSVTAAGAGLTYQWQLSTDNGVTWNNQADGGVYSNMTTATMSITGAILIMNTYQYRCVVSGTCPPSVTSTARILTVNAPPSITGQPVNSTVCAGGNTTFGVTATGAGLTYQWQLSTDNGVTWNNQANGGVYGNMTTATMSITGATNAMNTYQYRCVVSGTCPPSVNSTAGILTVNALPSITGQPSNQAVCVSGNTTFSVTATGAGLTYQWQLSTDNGVTWNNQANGGVYTNMTTATMNITGAIITMNTYQYRCVVSGTCPPAVNSTAGVLTVNAPPAITAQPVNSTVCAGGNTTFSVTATGAGLTYQWQLSTDNGVTWNNQANGGVYTNMTTATMSITGALITMNTYQYRCVVSGTCPPSVNSTAGILTVNALPAITGQPVNSTVCAGGNTTFSVTATGAGLTYQWQLSTDNGVTWNNQANGGVYSNMTTSTMSITGATNAMNTYQYRCVVSGTCPPSVNSTTGILTVNALPSITGQPVNQAVCVSGNTTFSVTATGAGLSYQWQLSTDNGVTWNNQANGGVYTNMTTATMSITGAIITMNTYQYRCVVSGTCPPSVNSTAGILTVNALPSITAQPSNQTICEGGNTTFSVTATGAGLTYQWQLSIDNGITWNNQADGGVYSNMTSSTMNLTGATLSMNTYQYRCVVSGTCPPSVNSNAGILSITAKPNITGQPTNQSTCVGGNTTFSVTATGAGLTYQWQLSTDNGVTWNNQANGGIYSNMTTAAMSITGALITMNTYQYRCVVSGTCPPSVNSTAGILTVNALPAITVQPLNSTVCSGSNTTFSITATGAGITYQWQLSTDNGVTWNNQADGGVYSNMTTSTMTITGALTGMNTYQYRCVVSGTCPPSATSSAVILTVNDTPSSSLFSSDASICLGNSTDLKVDITGGTSPYVVIYNDGTSNITLNPYISGSNITVSPLITTTYTLVSVTDANLCPSNGISGTPTVTVNVPPTSAVLSGTQTICNSSNANIVVAITGGTAPFTVVYNDGTSNITENGYISGSNIVVSPLVTTTYTLVSVTDANGCPAAAVSGTATITVNLPVSWDAISVENVNCHDEENGKITVDVSGVPPFLYSSDDGLTFVSNGGIFTNLTADDYYLAVQDGNSCVHKLGFPITVLNPDKITITSITKVSPSCTGDLDGSITVTSTGGTIYLPSLMKYYIDGSLIPNTTGIFNGLAAGDHIIIVEDDNGCTIDSTITLVAPTTIVFTDPQKTDITCFGLTDGTISAAATGGTGALTYTLLPGGVVTSADGNFTGLSAGSYTVQVNDTKGCSAVTPNLDIAEPAVFAFVSATSTPLDCNGDNSTITLGTTGGTAPISYNVTDGGAYNVTTTDGIFPAVPAGTYNYTITDAHTCNTFTGTVVITQPAPIVIDAPIVTQMTGPAANDGIISVTANGGTPPLQYDLNRNGVFVTTLTPGLGLPAIFNGLSAGTYTVDVIDSKGCTVSTSPLLIGLLDLTLTPTHVTCNGLNNGQIVLTINSGTPPYTITWTGPSGLLAFNNMLTISPLPPGLYSVNVVDGIGVTGSASITINEPAAFNATLISIVDKPCFGDPNGSVEFNITGGIAPYTISWTEGGVPKTSIINASPFKVNVAPGTYSFTISDVSSCPPLTIPNITLADPAKLNISNIEGVNLNCNGDASGSITVTAAGGTVPLDYSIAGPVNLNSSVGTFSNLPAGSYTVALTDANGCVASSDVSLAVTLTEPLPLTILWNTPGLPLDCPNVPNGNVYIQPSGGTGPNYTFKWSNGQTTQDLIGVVAGDYIVTITDVLGCKKSQLITVDGPSMFVITDTTITRARCSEVREGMGGDDEGSIRIEAVTGGTGPFEYQWNFPIDNPIKGDYIDKLLSGNYIVTTTDANKCVYRDTIYVPYDTAYYMNAYAYKDASICDAVSLDLAAIPNGLSPLRRYTYNWYEDPYTSGVPLSTDSLFTVNPLTTTKYLLEIRNDGGCLSRDYVNITVYPKIGLRLPLYVPGIQQDTIISLLSGSSLNLDVITENTEFPTSFSWEPAVLFTPADSWNSSIYYDKELDGLIPVNRRVTLKENPLTNRLTDYIVIDVNAITDKGCKDSLKLYVKMLENISIANVFTPNDDGINDRWEVPKDYFFPDLEVDIFNRWGALVWSARGDEAVKGWDGRTNNGKELPIGTYYFVVKYNIKSNDSNWKPITGSITIVR